MKVKTPSLIIAIIICLALASVCYLIAPEYDNRQWIALGVSFISILCTFVPAIVFDYGKGRREMSIKLMAWTGTLVTVVSNMFLSAYDCKTETYIIVTFLIVAVIDAIVYALYKS